MEFESSNCLISENTHRSTQNSNKYQYRAPQEWEKWKKKNKQKFINFSLRPTEKKVPQKRGDSRDYFTGGFFWLFSFLQRDFSFFHYYGTFFFFSVYLYFMHVFL